MTIPCAELGLTCCDAYNKQPFFSLYNLQIFLFLKVAHCVLYDVRDASLCMMLINLSHQDGVVVQSTRRRRLIAESCVR